MKSVSDYQRQQLAARRPFAANVVRVVPWAVCVAGLATCLDRPQADPAQLLPQLGVTTAAAVVLSVGLLIWALRYPLRHLSRHRARQVLPTRAVRRPVTPSGTRFSGRPVTSAPPGGNVPGTLPVPRITASPFDRRPYPEEVIDMVQILFGRPYADVIADVPAHSSQMDVEAMAERRVAEEKRFEMGMLDPFAMAPVIEGRTNYPDRGTEYDHGRARPRYLEDSAYPQ